MAKTLLLTPSWYPLIPHPEQLRLVHTKARYVVVPSGRRSGKTLRGKRKIVGALLKTCPGAVDANTGKWQWYEPGKMIWEKWQDSRFLVCAPTREQVKRIWWQDIKDLMPPWAIDPAHGGSVRETELLIRTTWGAELRLAGLDKPERAEGSTDLNGCIIDEFANVAVNSEGKGPFDLHIQPMLNRRKGWCWFMGVPDRDAPGQVEYEKFYLLAKSGKDPEWATYHWPSADLMEPAEIAKLMARMSKRDFDQEYGGQFILTSGRAFPDWDVEKHASTPCPYDPNLPICWSLDFNFNPQCSLVIQHKDGKVRVIDELALSFTKTDDVVEEFFNRADKNKWDISTLYLYGDPTGGQIRSEHGDSNWAIVNNRLRGAGITVKDRVQLKNISVVDNIRAIEGRLMNANGDISLHVDPACLVLIDDMRTALWPDPTGKDLGGQHALAGLRYFCEVAYPIERNHSRRVGAVGIANADPRSAMAPRQYGKPKMPGAPSPVILGRSGYGFRFPGR
jgi:hypothetical protein